MRVEINVDASLSRSVRDEDHFDLRTTPEAIEKIAEAQLYPPWRTFLTNLNAKDSLFSTFGSKIWTTNGSAGSEPCGFASWVDLIFLREDLNLGIGPHEELAKRLSELLTREPGNAMRVDLQISAAYFGEARGFCQRISLHALAATPEQAQLRWTLGLARLQQALLFVARGLRHELNAAL